MTYPDLDRLIQLMADRDLEAAQTGDPSIWSTGRGVLTTDEIRTALLGNPEPSRTPVLDRVLSLMAAGSEERWAAARLRTAAWVEPE